MRTISFKWRVPAVLLAIITAVGLGFLSTSTAQAVDTKVVHVGNLAGHAADCPDGLVGAHFVITQIGSAAPATITVVAGGTYTVARDKITGGTAHYVLATAVLVTDATAVVPVTWSGNFNLSDYRCAPTTTTSTTPSSSSTTPSSSTTT